MDRIHAVHVTTRCIQVNLYRLLAQSFQDRPEPLARGSLDFAAEVDNPSLPVQSAVDDVGYHGRGN